MLHKDSSEERAGDDGAVNATPLVGPGGVGTGGISWGRAGDDADADEPPCQGHLFRNFALQLIVSVLFNGV